MSSAHPCIEEPWLRDRPSVCEESAACARPAASCQGPRSGEFCSLTFCFLTPLPTAKAGCAWPLEHCPCPRLQR